MEVESKQENLNLSTFFAVEFSFFPYLHCLLMPSVKQIKVQLINLHLLQVRVSQPNPTHFDVL